MRRVQNFLLRTKSRLLSAKFYRIQISLFLEKCFTKLWYRFYFNSRWIYNDQHYLLYLKGIIAYFILLYYSTRKYMYMGGVSKNTYCILCFLYVLNRDVHINNFIQKFHYGKVSNFYFFLSLHEESLWFVIFILLIFCRFTLFMS